MDALLADQLYLSDPGPWQDDLLALGRFRVRGRLRPGQPREIQVAYLDNRGRVVLPRGLLAAVRRRVRGLRVRDQRLHFEPMAFGWLGQLRPEQFALVRAIVERGGNGIAVSMTGSGKTHIGLALAAELQQPALWITHRKDLAVAVRRTALQVWDVSPSAIGYIGEGESRLGSHLTIALVQTLARRKNTDLLSRIGTIIVDESHHEPATSYHGVLSQFPAKFRIGLTGTYEREDGLHPLMAAVFGPRIALPDQVLVRLGRIMLPTIHPIYTRFQAPDGLSWAKLQQARAADRARNVQLLAHIKACFRAGRVVLVLVARVDHARWLAQQLQFNGVPAAAIVGAMPVVERQQWYRRFLGRRCVLVATSLADEGLDLPQCDTLEFATPGRSATTLRQRAGRVMRTAAGKGDARIYDWVDGGHPTLAAQWRHRQAVYRQQGWPVIPPPERRPHGQQPA